MRAAPLLSVVLVCVSAGVAPAGPVVVDLPDRAAAKAAVVTIGDVATVFGGDPAERDRVARLDVAEIKPRDATATVSRSVIEFRLRLAGIDPATVVLSGAEKVTVTATRRAVTADEVVTAARAELLRRLPWSPESVAVELVAPVVVRLPEVFAGETVTIAAQPHGPITGPGRVQMDATVSAGGQRLLALGVQFEVKAAGPAAAAPGAPVTGVVPAVATTTVPGAVMPASAVAPLKPAEQLVKPRQRVTLVVRLGGPNVVTAAGEAQQGGTLGQTIPVQNVDSKKIVIGRVSGPGVVDVDLGGVP